VGRAGITRARLAEAGGELADELGFDQVTVSELARRFGVRPATLYSHVESSHDLRTQIALLSLEQLAALASEALAGRSGKEALAAYADAFRDFAREHPGRYAAAQYRLDPVDSVASTGARHAELARTILRGYDVHGDDQTHAVRLLASMIHGYIALELSGGFSHSEPPPDQTWLRLISALDSMLRTMSDLPG
jgi:AcrR family transcriptional regulator